MDRESETAPNETCKQVLRYMFQHASVLTVSHLSSIVPLSVRMTPKAYEIIVGMVITARMVPDDIYVPIELSQHAFFAVHDLLELGLVEETENLDG